MTNVEKSWWAPVWRGLVKDPEGKHVRRLKGAMSLLLYLIIHADRKTGVVARKIQTIAKDMGISAWTVRAWMRRLRRAAYIIAKRTGRATVVRIARWRSLGHPHTDQTGTQVPTRWARMQQDENGDRQKSKDLCDIPGRSRHANKSIHTRALLQEERGLVRVSPMTSTRGTGVVKAREELLAEDLAEGLGDPDGLTRYRDLVRRYPEELLRRLMSEARAVPRDEIRRSRAAVFRYLLNQHNHGAAESARN